MLPCERVSLELAATLSGIKEELSGAAFQKDILKSWLPVRANIQPWCAICPTILGFVGLPDYALALRC